MMLKDLPSGYEEALHFRVTKGSTIIWLNIFAVVMMLVVCQ
jgi:hypothetical protein